MPKVRSPPIVPKKPRKEIQMLEREACSWRVHQMEVMATKPGEMVDSKAPRRKRTVAREAKEEQVAVSIRIAAQRMMFTFVSFVSLFFYVKRNLCGRGVKGVGCNGLDLLPRNFAIGKRCKRATPGYSIIIYPK